jgi:two-component system KDP operon response regulator KdpE
MSHNVLLVEADGPARVAAARELESNDFEVSQAGNALEGLREVYEQRPGAVIVNLAMPEMDGEEFTRIVRALADVPILAIGPAGDPELIVRVLDGGADDYLEQPVSEIELVGRLRAALRRVARQTASERAPTVRSGDLEIDLGERTLRKRGDVIPLTPTEWGLLAALAHRVGHVAPHRFLLSTVWGEEYVDDTHYLRIYIGYLRKKIEDNPSEPLYLLSQWGTGYRLADLPAAGAPPMLVPVRRSDEESDEHLAIG